jgi:RND family efflux transporter MFP subunit
MKTLLKILPLIALFVGCNSNNSNYDKLVAERDSLQNVLYKTTLDINKIDLAITEIDTSLDVDKKVIMKKIINQKTKIAKIEKDIRSLENLLVIKRDGSNLPVEVKTIDYELFNHYFIVFGNVEADKYARLSTEMGGRVKKLYVEEGQYVKQGTLLLTLNTDAIDKQIVGIKSSLDFAENNYKKQKRLWEQNIGSEIQYLQAKTTKEGLESQLKSAQAKLRMSQLTAPFDGIVNKIYIKKSEMAGPQFPAIEFVNMSKMLIKANVSEKYISSVKKGQIVELTFSSIPDFKADIPVARVSNVLNPKSRTFEIELKFDNKNELIKPNMVSTIRINDFSTNKAFVIPSLVIKKDIAGDYVYVVVNKGSKSIVEKRPITAGKSYQDKTMIVSGLQVGDRVVVKGYNLVSAGIPVNIK